MKKKFKNASDFAEYHVRKNDLKCRFCGKEFLRTIVLKRHMMNHSGFRDYKCQKCPKTFINKDLLHLHQRTHEKGNFPCAHCNKTFRNRDYARRHERRHIRKRDFECEICGCICISRDNIKSHILNIHFW